MLPPGTDVLIRHSRICRLRFFGVEDQCQSLAFKLDMSWVTLRWLRMQGPLHEIIPMDGDEVRGSEALDIHRKLGILTPV